MCIRSFGDSSNKTIRTARKIGNSRHIGSLQTAVLISTTAILRRVLNL